MQDSKFHVDLVKLGSGDEKEALITISFQKDYDEANDLKELLNSSARIRSLSENIKTDYRIIIEEKTLKMEGNVFLAIKDLYQNKIIYLEQYNNLTRAANFIYKEKKYNKHNNFPWQSAENKNSLESNKEEAAKKIYSKIFVNGKEDGIEILNIINQMYQKETSGMSKIKSSS